MITQISLDSSHLTGVSGSIWTTLYSGHSALMRLNSMIKKLNQKNLKKKEK